MADYKLKFKPGTVQIVMPPDSAERFRFTLKKMKFTYSEKRSGHDFIFTVQYNKPIEMYYLGCTAMADQHRLFESGITQ